MKKATFVLITTLITLIPLCLIGYAKSGPLFSAYVGEAGEIPLVREGDNYYIRPQTNNESSFVVMLPLSAVLGEYAEIELDHYDGRISITCGTLDVDMEIGSVEYVINGEDALLDAPPEIIDGTLYVPATFFEKTFGFWMTDTGEGVIDLFMPNFIIENI